MMLPAMQPVPVADVPKGIALRIVAAAGAGFPSPAQDWEDDAISLIELLRLDRPASFVFRISGSSMIDAGIYDNDVVVVDRDTRPAGGHIVIAVVDGGFVCRQLVRRRGAILLEARNSQQCYEAISAEGVEIWGVVRTGVRDYRR
ncbi:LexA family protein [Sphingomonas sp. CCH18-H6]|uniref:LexA family protein n=1 Tax=Sphingomonas sp. CCH18-H6 TaxID=1768787 RepID=UPI000833FA87|nr:S24 family peptidase [Sphingomonas sp. CCH18-H6]